jgi:hypothetical protein
VNAPQDRFSSRSFQDVSYCTVRRFLKRLDLVGRRPQQEPTWKRFA